MTTGVLVTHLNKILGTETKDTLFVYFNFLKTWLFFFQRGPTPTKYLIFYRNMNDLVQPLKTKESLVTTSIVQNLSPNTQYEFYIVPYNKDAAGPRSKIVNIKTPTTGNGRFTMAMVSKMCFFFKLNNFFLVDIIPKVLSTRTTRNHNDIPLFNVKHKYFRNSFFPCTINQWKKINNNIPNLESVSAFKKQILNFIRPTQWKPVKRVFTREISSRYEIIPVYGEMPLTVYTFLSRWNFIPD